MSDEKQNKKSLSDISHLFLSGVRESVTGGVRPSRVPPGGVKAPSPRDMSIDMTPEEFAHVFGDHGSETADKERPPVGPVSAVIAPQFGSNLSERVKDYAAHLASNGDRVGLIEIDAAECRVTCFEKRTGDDEPGESTETIDVRTATQALEELAWDVDRWVVLAANLRTPEARDLLRGVDKWTLLSTCDHDGVVACYRAIKGVAEGTRPKLSLALMNAPDATEAGRVFRKIAGVCQQFLNWPLDSEPAVEPTDSVIAHEAMVFRPARERSAIGAGPQWELVGDLLTKAREQAAELATAPAAGVVDEPPPDGWTDAKPVESVVRPATTTREPIIQETFRPEAVMSQSPVAEPVVPQMKVVQEVAEVMDLPGGDATPAGLLATVIDQPTIGLARTAVVPPMCPSAVVAVSRDCRLTVVAVAGKGLTELRSIAAAYRWVIENRPLLSMALPQFSVDGHAMPALKLIVDRSDAGADLLLPMTDNGNVTLMTYRKLRWGGKTGLLMEAA